MKKKQICIECGKQVAPQGMTNHMRMHEKVIPHGAGAGAFSGKGGVNPKEPLTALAFLEEALATLESREIGLEAEIGKMEKLVVELKEVQIQKEAVRDALAVFRSSKTVPHVAGGRNDTV